MITTAEFDEMISKDVVAEQQAFAVTYIDKNNYIVQVGEIEEKFHIQNRATEEIFHFLMCQIGVLSYKAFPSVDRAIYLMSQFYPNKGDFCHSIHHTFPYKVLYGPKDYIEPIFDFKVRMIKEEPRVLNQFMNVVEFENQHPEYFLD